MLLINGKLMDIPINVQPANAKAVKNIRNSLSSSDFGADSAPVFVDGLLENFLRFVS
jgi:hypothetical protein